MTELSASTGPSLFRDCPEATRAQVRVLWGKQKDGFALLAEHLLDTAAVGEIMWDEFLSPAVRSMLDRAADGDGRRFFAWLCGVHDIGKAAPSFQCKVDSLAAAVKASGLDWPPLRSSRTTVHHSIAGGRILRNLLPTAGWSRQATEWIWPLVDGHHGLFHGLEAINTASTRAVAPTEAWRDVQLTLLDAIGRAVGHESLAQLQPAHRPTRGEQLTIAGLMVMADWIASNDVCRGGERDIDRLTMSAARDHAAKAWSALQLRGGWRNTDPLPSDLMAARFGRSPRPVQAAMAEVCEHIPAPGIIVVEAAMGEGKTELSLIGAEILAHRFGLDGMFDGMPTQATSDQMFERVMRWSEAQGEAVPVALSHGRRRFNPLWQRIASQTRPVGVDEYGQDDPYGGSSEQTVGLAVEWLMGRNRPLLTPICVGTIDNEFHAATRTKFVALRFAGLAGKVVILDEIHAYSLYMRQFLFESLRWLGSAGVPVILLTATLPPAFKEQALAAYVEGRTEGRLDPGWRSPAASGYPVITWATADDDRPVAGVATCPSGLPERRVRVEMLPDGSDRSPAPLADLLSRELQSGGRVLIVRNTVGRAQATYAELAERFGDDVVLLHSRYTAIDRSDRTQAELDRLGPEADTTTGQRHILVATQVAEQSFDIDVDLLITDVAPMDLLLQRIGRMHRRAERDPQRPGNLRNPRVIVAGMTSADGGAPEFPFGVEKIYSPFLLLRTAAMVIQAAKSEGWLLPTQVPDLVALAYSEEPVTSDWSEEFAVALACDSEEKQSKEVAAERFLLSREEDRWSETLAGLHRLSTRQLSDDDAVSAVVRDGPETVEAILVLSDGGDFRTLTGRQITRSGALVADDPNAIEEAAGSVIRLPFQLTRAAQSELNVPTSFSGDGYLRNMRVVPLDEEWSFTLGGQRLHYDPRLGLVAEPARGRNE